MKKLIILASSFLFFACAHQPESGKAEFHCMGEPVEFHLAAHEISGKGEPYVSHSGTQKFSNYVVVSLNYAPFVSLFEELQKKFGSLKNRSEAHVTVITPPEFDDVLSSFLTMKEIDALASESFIQNFRITPVCLGRGEAVVNGVKERNYFIVVTSSQIIEFRRKVFAAFVAKGGEPSRFDPENFYPHITVGFSLRDLHESDGVRKGKNACISKISLQ